MVSYIWLCHLDTSGFWSYNNIWRPQKANTSRARIIKIKVGEKMSIPQKVNISCPRCGKQYETTIFESLNTDFAPNLAQSVVSGEYFSTKCPSCGFVAHLEYDILYHDMEHNAMVWVVHRNGKNYQQRLAEIMATPLFPDYKVIRIVADMKALREKAACLEAEKDDRIIELCKIFLENQLIEQYPDYHLKSSFYTYSEGKQTVFFYDEDGNEKSCSLDDRVYALVFRLFKKVLLQMDDSSWQMIDRSWAIRTFENLQEDDVSNLISSEEACDALLENDEESAGAEENAKVEEAIGAKDPPILFCRKCGAKLLPDSLFCSYCGTKVVF